MTTDLLTWFDDPPWAPPEPDPDRWRAVPGRVAALVAAAVPPARALKMAMAGHPARVYWNVRTKRAWVENPRGARVPDLPVPYDEDALPPPPGDWDVVLVKHAAEPDGWMHRTTVGDLVHGVGDLGHRITAPLGGPSPLAATIAGALIGGGLGYGLGRGAEAVMGDTVDRGRARRNLAVLGALAGSLPGLYAGTVAMRNPDRTGGGLQSWITRWPAKQSSAAGPSGILNAPSIPVDAFNQVIWSDVVEPPHPFGTRSPWGTNEQPVGTPPAVAAAASGLLSGAGALAGRDRVSPLEVGLAAGAAGAGGYVAGLTVGKLFGALAGLRPEHQQALRRAGLWGGLMTGAMSAVFGG